MWLAHTFFGWFWCFRVLWFCFSRFVLVCSRKLLIFGTFCLILFGRSLLNFRDLLITGNWSGAIVWSWVCDSVWVLFWFFYRRLPIKGCGLLGVWRSGNITPVLALLYLGRNHSVHVCIYVAQIRCEVGVCYIRPRFLVLLFLYFGPSYDVSSKPTVLSTILTAGPNVAKLKTRLWVCCFVAQMFFRLTCSLQGFLWAHLFHMRPSWLVRDVCDPGYTYAAQLWAYNMAQVLLTFGLLFSCFFRESLKARSRGLMAFREAVLAHTQVLVFKLKDGTSLWGFLFRTDMYPTSFFCKRSRVYILSSEVTTQSMFWVCDG